MSEPLTLSNAQLSALLPLLPALAQYSSASTTEPAATVSFDNGGESARHYTNEEMLQKNKKNGRSTRAQTYLLVSSNYTLRVTVLWFVLLHKYVTACAHANRLHELWFLLLHNRIAHANKKTNFCG